MGPVGSGTRPGRLRPRLSPPPIRPPAPQPAGAEAPGDRHRRWLRLGLRPGFIAGHRAGTVAELAYPMLLAAHGVPAWLLRIGFGRSAMSRHRLVERLGRSSLAVAHHRGGAPLPARVPEGPRPRPQGPRPAPSGVGRLPCRLRGGVPTADGRASTVVCPAGPARPGARDADEAVGRDGALRSGLRPSGMPSHEQRGGPPDEPAVPADGCGPGSARPSGPLRVAAEGPGAAAGLPPLCPAERPPPDLRQPRGSAQGQAPP